MQRGYITIVVIVFLLFLSLIMYPWEIPPPVDIPCQLGIKPASEFTLKMPGISKRDQENRTPEGTADTTQGGPDLNSPDVDYILVRERVPFGPIQEDIFVSESHAIPVGDVVTITKPSETGNYQVYYPMNYGEFDAPFEFKTSYENHGFGGKDNQYRFRQEGFIYFIKVDDDGSIFKMIDGKKIYTVDLYQQVAIFNDPSRPYDDNGEIFDCAKGQSAEVVSQYNTDVIIPKQSPSVNKDTLQLEWFKFENSVYMGAHCKPAIYLYPKEKTLVNVKVNSKGYLTYVDPPYPKNGWNVTAYPDGKIQDSRFKIYDYLYYESKVPDQLIEKPTKGWVVPMSNLESLYKEILPQLGLNEAQTRDFIEYWNRSLPQSPYYFVGLVDQSSVNNAEPLEITPKPDSINRVRIYFEKLDQPRAVTSPELSLKSSIINPKSFNVLEWGGFIKNDPNHPYTCSQ